MGCICNIPDYLVDPDGNNLMDNGLNQPIDLAVFTPWVRILVSGSPDNLANAQIITVGNQSQGSQLANACIKSFQFGVSDGFVANFEIVDIESGNFCNFINKLTRNLDEQPISTDNLIWFQWGMNGSSCNPQSSTPYADITSSWHKAYITQIVPTYERGMFKFVLNCVDLSDTFRQQIVPVNNDGDISLVMAIFQLFFNSVIPPVDDIQFMIRDGDGRPRLQSITDLLNAANSSISPVLPPSPIFASTNGVSEQFVGPTAKWSYKSRDSMSILHDWLGVVKSINNKGFIVCFDDNTLIIKEDDKPGCDKPPANVVFATRRVYIVNGGQNSKVIDFTPHMKWLFFQELRAGGGQPVNQNEDMPQDNLNDCVNNFGSRPRIAVGLQTVQSPEHPVDEGRGKDAMNLRMEADKLQLLTENVFTPIKATLKLQGDPTLESITDVIGSFITVVVINPFVPNSSPNSCDWLIQTVGGEQSPCNSVLSNKNWMITGFFHDMKEGSYVTTLEILLATPGIDTPVNDNLGQ